MGKRQRKTRQGTMGDKLRPKDPGKYYEPYDVTATTYDDGLHSLPLMNSNVKGTSSAKSDLTTTMYDDDPSHLPSRDLQGMSTEIPDLPATMSNDDQSTLLETGTVIIRFMRKVVSIGKEINNIRRKNMTVLYPNSGITNELMDQVKPLLERKTKVLEIMSRFRNKFEAMVEDFDYGSLNSSNREDLECNIEGIFSFLESMDENNSSLNEIFNYRRELKDIKKIRQVPESRSVVCNETQLYYSEVEMPLEEVELQSAVMEVIPEQSGKVETSIQLIYVSESYELVEEDFVENLPPEELKYVNIIYINLPEDIMNNDMNDDNTEDGRKNLENVCKSERFPYMYLPFGNGPNTPRNLTTLAYMYLSPGFKYRDRDNGPSKELVSGFINKIWNHNVYDRGKTIILLLKMS